MLSSESRKAAGGGTMSRRPRSALAMETQERSNISWSPSAQLRSVATTGQCCHCTMLSTALVRITGISPQDQHCQPSLPPAASHCNNQLCEDREHPPIKIFLRFLIIRFIQVYLKFVFSIIYSPGVTLSLP